MKPKRPPPKKPAGIAPSLLLEQVRATAPWAFGQSPRLPAEDVLATAPDVERTWLAGDGGAGYFALLLAAHFTTVGTFCPTDVDARIREHAWRGLSGDRLAAAVARVEEVASWPVAPVTARHVVVDGEVLGAPRRWFACSPRARPRLALGDTAVVARPRVDRGGARARPRSSTRCGSTARRAAARVATTVAHNLGDLSRVVDTWAPAHAASELGVRYRRLGHDDGARFDGAFVYAGELNKKLMALENHRFLPLRKPAALRRERAFLLPFGPYFHDWGKLVGSTKLLDDHERAEILHAPGACSSGAGGAAAGRSPIHAVRDAQAWQLWPAGPRNHPRRHRPRAARLDQFLRPSTPA